MPAILDAFAAHAARAPSRPAITVRRPDGSFAETTRGELLAAARAAARAIAERPHPGVAAFAGRRGPAAAAHLLGARIAGRPFAFLDPRLPEAKRDALRARLAAHAPPETPPIGAVLFTSGSTGGAKGVLVPEEDLDLRAAAEAAWYGLSEDDVLLGLLPLSFDVGLAQLVSALFSGAELVLVESWLPGDLLDAAAARRVTGISGVPSIWRAMLSREARFPEAGPGRPRYITVSGGDLARADLLRLPELAAGAGIFKTYGQTETFRTASLRPEEFGEAFETVGRAFPGAAFRVVRTDGGEAAVGEEGEVLHAGLGTFAGYLGEHERPAKLVEDPFAPPGGPRRLAVRTGDAGVVDAAGRLTLRGRMDAMLKVGGNRFYPRETAEAIRARPGVADVAVVAAGERDGETIVAAFVVPERPGAVDPARLRRDLRKALPPWAIPAVVRLLATMPLTPHGKPDLAALSALARGTECP